MAPIDDLAQVMNRQVTDENGQAIEENETPLGETSTPEEQTTVNEDAQAEKPADLEVEATQSKTDEDEIDNLVELASDETGKRYVPESRFKEVYGKMKDFERALKEPKAKETTLPPAIKPETLDKSDKVEIELLRATLPQFNPDSSDYSEELDQLGFAIYKATPGLSRIEAARKAVGMAKKIQSKVAAVKDEARQVKSIQSDQGITGRVTSRESTSDIPPDDASPEDMEKWLKTHGQW